MSITAKHITIGISGPINLQLLNWKVDKGSLPDTNAFPLTSHLINALLQRGYKVIGYTNSNDIAEQMVLSEGNLTVCIGRTKPQAGRRMFDFEIEELTSLMRLYPSDVIYAFWSYEYSWAGLNSGIPTIVSVHDIAYKIFLTQPDAFRLVRWYMSYKVLSKAKYVVANSDYTFSQLSAALKEKASVIYNFYDDSFEQSVPQNLDKQNYILSISMGFTKRKGVPRSLKAFAKIRKKFPEVTYRLIGAGMEPNGEAHQYALKNNLADGVEFLGILPFDEVLKQVAQAKLLLHASVEESFGMAVLEAMVLGTAVIGGQKSGFIPYLLNHGKAGMLCNVYKPEAIAAAVEKLLTEEAYADQLVKNAKEHARSNFSESAVLDKFEQYIQQVYKQSASALALSQPGTKHREIKNSIKNKILPIHEA